jgi:hypothetical protein
MICLLEAPSSSKFTYYSKEDESRLQIYSFFFKNGVAMEHLKKMYGSYNLPFVDISIDIGCKRFPSV